MSSKKSLHVSYKITTLLEFTLALTYRVTVGVASKPIKPRPPYFAGFLIYGNRKFVENLKSIGAIMRKLLLFQFNTAMYIACNLKFLF